MTTKPLTIRQFRELFPTEAACLDHLLEVRYGREGDCPKCGRKTRWLRIAKEPAYQCQWHGCGHHVHPMMGTPFARTRTPLQSWFYAMYLFTTTRNGVAAKELQRALGVTYKTAWRMGHEIRKHMAAVDGDAPIGGGDSIVEADKTFLGGRDKQGEDDKAVILGMVERGGDVITRHIKSKSTFHVVPPIAENVRPGSRIATDEARAFEALGMQGFRHHTVNHKSGEYVRGEVHTNTIEAFWSQLKRTINGTHIWVSKKHLPKYLGELEYRFNLRHASHAMFDLLLHSFAPPSTRALR